MDALLQLKDSLADRYDIKREIGAGGMATVYLAQDLRHDRPVALKLLNPELGAVLGPERFLAEIRVTANLQHPNLLPLFDSGAVDGLLYYVMPFVDGETLRARLNREKQLPVDEAVRITVAVANALDYAHSHGVIHRDLKPENILMQAGQPVIADFGIALAVSNAGGNRITQTGLSLGTPQYMSPEQATGDRVIDGRSDIYSLGAVSYEMLTGEPPHTGSTSQAIIARMLTEKPRSMRTSRAAIPEHVEFAVQHALEKLPADRFSAAHEFADAIQGHGNFGTTVLHTSALAGSRAGVSSWKSRLRDPLTIGLAAIAVAALAFAALKKPATATAERVIRFVLATPDSLKAGSMSPWPAAISPDGSIVVYAPRAQSLAYFVRTDQLEPREIPGTESATQPLFSPDGEYLAFESNGKFKKTKLDGSAPTAVTDAGAQNGADWTTRDEIIIGSEGLKRGLSRVSASGGDLVEFVKPDRKKGETDYLWPIASPDGKTVAFAIWYGSLASTKLATVSIGGTDVRELGVKGIRPLAIVGKTLVYVQADGAVMGLKLKSSWTQADGSPVPVLDPVLVSAGLNGNSEIFVSQGGALVTARGGSTSKLAWIAKDGSTTPAAPEIRVFSSPRLSPEGKRIAVVVTDQGKTDIWIEDLENRTFSRLSQLESASSPVWSSDGKTIYFVAVVPDKDQFAVFAQRADGGTPAEKIVETVGPAAAVTVSPDGKSLVFVSYNDNSWNTYRVALDSARAAKPYIVTKGNETNAVFSPDSHWVAYVSDQAGRPEIFMRSYPDPAAQVQVSTGGGGEPVWSSDGTRIYYRSSAGNALLAAKISWTPTVRVVARDTVISQMGATLQAGLTSGYDVSHDGRILSRLSNNNSFELVVVPNWRIEMEKRLAAANKR